jgi:hypothetical protein
MTYIILLKQLNNVSRDSSVGRAFDCRGKRHQTVTGSIPVRENFFECLAPQCGMVRTIPHSLS